MTNPQPSSTGGMLGYARAILDGRLRLSTADAARAAALLARCAFEEVVHDLCRVAGTDMRDATMRSQLTTIRVLCSEPIADPAETAWAGLTRACHHHAYELTPTSTEVHHLIELVETLAATPAPHADT